MVFIKSFRNQSWLLPPNIKDIIPKDHICFLVEEIVDKIDFSEFEIKYLGAGHPAYHPRITVKLLTQSMLDRIRSSRAIARNARENVVFMYLAENLAPDFRTISDFRKDNSKLLKDIFKITVLAAKELGAIGLEHLSIDGSKLKASASNMQTATEQELKVIEDFVNTELSESIKLDKMEDEQFKDIRGYDQLGNNSQKKIKSLIEKYMKQTRKNKENTIPQIKDSLEKARKELEENHLKKVSLTDPSSRFMKNKKGNFELSYNPQITTDNKMGFIVANDVCQDAADCNQLKPQIEIVEENCGKLKEQTKVSADNGYHSGENINYLNNKKLDGYMPDKLVAQKNKGKTIVTGKFDKANFIYDEKADEYICPEKNKLKFTCEYYSKEKKKLIREYVGMSCRHCPLNLECTKRKDKIRRLSRYPFEKERNELAVKMKTKEAKEIYQRRKETVEPAIGSIKENLGVRGFLTRGLSTVKNEFNLACSAFNIKKIWILLRIQESNGRGSQ